jgi:hypothetical protein
MWIQWSQFVVAGELTPTKRSLARRFIIRHQMPCSRVVNLSSITSKAGGTALIPSRLHTPTVNSAHKRPLLSRRQPRIEVDPSHKQIRGYLRSAHSIRVERPPPLPVNSAPGKTHLYRTSHTQRPDPAPVAVAFLASVLMEGGFEHIYASPVTIGAIAVSLASVGYIIAQKLQQSSRSNGVLFPPGPPRDFLIGNLRQFPKDHFYDKFCEWQREYGKRNELHVA